MCSACRYTALACLLALAACGSSSQSDGQASVSDQPEPDPPAPSPRDAGPPHAGMVQPYFAEGAAREAAELYGREEFEPSRQAFRRAKAEIDAEIDAEIAAKANDAAQAHRIDFMIAVTSALVDDWPAAIEGFEAALPRFPLFADWIHHQLARAYHASEQYDKALHHARQVDRDSAQGDPATLIAGNVLRYREAPEVMVEFYRDYLERGKVQRLEARFRLAGVLERLGKHDEAMAEYRWIMVHAPFSPWAKIARKQMEQSLRRLPPRKRGKLRWMPPAERIARAMVYYDANRNQLAEAEFAAILKMRNLSKEERCTALYHRANSWWKLRNRTKAMPIFEEAIAACDKTGLVDLQVKSAFQAGRSLDKLDDEEKSIARLKLIEKNHPEHSYADDARLLQAEAYQELGKIEEMKAALAAIPELYPDGDMKAEAVWRLAWIEYSAGNYKTAIEWLEKQIAIEPIADHWERTGQAQYWIARCHGHLGDSAQAIRYYRETIRLYPLSYYSLLALNRLREQAPEVFAEVQKQIATPPEDPDEGAIRITEHPRYHGDDFQRAIELARLGLLQSAVAELAAMGIVAPPGKQRLEDPEAIETTWIFALLNHQAGRYSQSHWVTRWHVLDYRRHWPEGSWREKWQIAYPRAWWELLHRHATERGYATELLIAFVREESGFDPQLESWANAIGLTQMILPTAENYAEAAGVEVTRETLLDPETNVAIGSRFLESLVQRWGGLLTLVVPSYNTGESRVAGWLREAPDAALDEFAENIYYDEPRRYNKRVTESFFIYSYLVDRTIPIMPNKRPGTEDSE